MSEISNSTFQRPLKRKSESSLRVRDSGRRGPYRPVRGQTPSGTGTSRGRREGYVTRDTGRRGGCLLTGPGGSSSGSCKYRGGRPARLDDWTGGGGGGDGGPGSDSSPGGRCPVRPGSSASSTSTEESGGSAGGGAASVGTSSVTCSRSCSTTPPSLVSTPCQNHPAAPTQQYTVTRQYHRFQAACSNNILSVTPTPDGREQQAPTHARHCTE